MVGFLIFLALAIYLLVLAMRLVNAVERIANSTEDHERQVGRLAVAVEQLVSSRTGGAPLSDPAHEG